MKKTILVHVVKVQFIMWKVLSPFNSICNLYDVCVCVYTHTRLIASLDGGGIE